VIGVTDRWQWRSIVSLTISAASSSFRTRNYLHSQRALSASNLRVSPRSHYNLGNCRCHGRTAESAHAVHHDAVCIQLSDSDGKAIIFPMAVVKTFLAFTNRVEWTNTSGADQSI